jgi:hypothetical protein
MPNNKARYAYISPHNHFNIISHCRNIVNQKKNFTAQLVVASREGVGAVGRLEWRDNDANEQKAHRNAMCFNE